MYRLSTYFYWFLIWYIQIYQYIQFLFLRILRGPINKFIVWFAKKYYGIIINWDGGSDIASKPIEFCPRINVHNPNTFIRIINEGNLGLGESYMEGWWDFESPEHLETTLLSLWNIFGNVRPHFIQLFLDWIYLNADDKPWESQNNGWARSLGSDFTQITLGPNQNYNAGIWNNLDKVSTNLEHAQLEAMHQLGEQLKLSPGMKVLDLGCGHGALARHLADTYDVSVTGVTRSLEESTAAKAYGHQNVEILKKDYRDLPMSFQGKFDAVISIHMMEHLGGPKYYKEFFDTVNKYLKPGGLFVLQTYVLHHMIHIRSDHLTRKYLYSSSVVPHYMEIMEKIRGHFLIEQVKDMSENMEPFYSVLDKNFESAWHLLQPRYDIKYYRLLKLALAVSIVMARGKKLQDWVLVLSKME